MELLVLEDKIRWAHQMFGVKEIVPRMLARGRGHVVNIASTAGKGGFPGGATYCGTKHYVVGLSEAGKRLLESPTLMLI